MLLTMEFLKDRNSLWPNFLLEVGQHFFYTIRNDPPMQ